MCLLRYALSIFLLSSAVFSQADRDDNTNYWIVPKRVNGNKAGDYSNNDVYTIGSTIELQWKSNFSSVVLSQNQDLAKGDTVVFITQNGNPLQKPSSGLIWSYNWTVSVPPGWNLSACNVFWLTFWGNSDYHLSHYFNISDPSTSAQSTTTSNSQVSGSTTSAGAIPSATKSSAGSTVSPVSASSGGLSSGAKIGIGVGVSLGVLCLVLGGAVIWLIARRRTEKKLSQKHSPSVPAYAPVEQKPYQQEPPYVRKEHELPQTQVHELPYQQQQQHHPTYEMSARQD